MILLYVQVLNILLYKIFQEKKIFLENMKLR